MKELLDMMKDTIILMQQTYILLLQREVRNAEFLAKRERTIGNTEWLP